MTENHSKRRRLARASAKLDRAWDVTRVIARKDRKRAMAFYAAARVKFYQALAL